MSIYPWIPWMIKKKTNNINITAPVNGGRTCSDCIDKYVVNKNTLFFSFNVSITLPALAKGGHLSLTSTPVVFLGVAHLQCFVLGGTTRPLDPLLIFVLLFVLVLFFFISLLSLPRLSIVCSALSVLWWCCRWSTLVLGMSSR